MHASLRNLADRWIAVKNTARPSPNTVSARIYDLAVVGESLGGSADPEDKLAVLNQL